MSMLIKKIKRFFFKYMPQSLYIRTVILIIAPMVLLQSVISYVFMERHWQMVTERLSTAVVNDIASIIDSIETYPQRNNYQDIIRIASQRLELNIALLPPAPLPPAGPKPFFAILDYFLSKQITEKIKKPFWLDTIGDSNLIEIRIKLKHNILRVFATRSQTYASNTIIFLSWMIGTALVLIIIAIYFLRLQIKPIQQLAIVAEKFGRGQHLSGYYPKGASEVRRAGLAFLRMRQRIERQIDQKTMMLSGVSHDLRTILTRFKLELALLSPTVNTQALEQDVIDMTKMIDGYLAFSKGEGKEELSPFSLKNLIEKLNKEALLHGCKFQATINCPDMILVRPRSFTRLINNLMSNAFKYATSIKFSAKPSGKKLLIHIDDNGPGIPSHLRIQVFKPFFRVDEARNQNTSGTGLSLSIALDIARSHGGNLILAQSPLGGLRATIHLPC